MPCFSTTSCVAAARLVFGSFSSTQRASMPRLARRSFRISSICLSWNSTSARIVTMNSLQLEHGARVLEIEALLELAVGLVHGVRHFVGIELGNDIERRHERHSSVGRG